MRKWCAEIVNLLKINEKIDVLPNIIVAVSNSEITALAQALRISFCQKAVQVKTVMQIP